MSVRVQHVAKFARMSLEWIHPFLRAIESGCTVVEAAQQAGIASAQAYTRAKHDADFRAAWDDAKEASADLLEKEARRRAVDGLEEPIIHKGEPTYVYELDEAGNAIYDIVEREIPNLDGGVTISRVSVPRKKLDENGQPVVMTVRKPSDALLMFLLKGRRPQVFGTDRQEISGPGGGPVEQKTVIVTGIDRDAARDALRAEDIV